MEKVCSFAFAVLGLLILARAWCEASPAEGTAAEVPIKTITVEGLSSVSKAEFLDLLGFKVGKPLDRREVRIGIKRAFLKGIFEDIEVHADERGADVTVVVKERYHIGKIRIRGNDSLSKRTIRRAFLLKEGEIMRTDLLSEATKRLEDDLSVMGFPNAVVSVEVSPTVKPYTSDLTVTVKEGEPVRIEGIAFRGVSEEEARGIMRIREGDIYDRQAIGKEIERVREHFKKLGYLNPLVTYTFRDGILEVDIRKGKKLSLHFEGNSLFSSKKLLKEMPFSEAGEVRDDYIDEADRKIISLYHDKGYPFAQVAPVVSESVEKGEDIVDLRFFIFEGERVKVGTLSFSGMTLPEENVKDVLPLKEGDPYNPDLLSSDMDVIREFYIALGYREVELEGPEVTIEDGRAKIFIKVKEGPKTVIERIEITGSASVPIEEIRKVIGLKEGSPYNEVDIADSRLRIMDIYREKGFLSVEADAKVEFAGEGALITFGIREGERTFFGKTIIIGNTQTKREVIERELIHREATPFNYSLLAKERQKLYKLGLFTDVRVEGLDPYDHESDVRIDVAEGDAGTVDVSFGYDSYYKFTGLLNVGYRNLFGMNRQISLKVGYSSLEKLASLDYLDPWFLDRHLQFKGTLFYVNKENKNIDTKVIMYRYRKTGVAIGIEKPYTSAVKGELYYEYALWDTFDVQPGMILTPQDVGRLNVGSLRPGVTYDTRDNPFDPRNGILAGASVKLASQALLSQTNFAKAVFNGSLYHELAKPLVLALAFRFGVAQAWGASTPILPLEERFFLGGRDTVRGYAQDTVGPLGINVAPTGGNAFIETNVELRTFLWKGLGIVTFIDSGNVWQKASEIDWSIRHTIGAGLRYNTPIGPLRLDYGYKLKAVPGLSRSEIFFSIGQAF